MASSACAAALSPSSAAATLSPPNRGPTLAFLHRKARPFSLSVDRSSTSPAPLLSAPPLVSPSTLFSRKWKLSAAPEGSPEETEEPSMPEPVEAQIAAAATPKGEDVFAVIMVGSRQYIVFPGRFIYTQRLKGANVDDKIILNKVLLVGTRTKTYIGQPVVTNAAVHAVVEEQGLDKKVIVFKFKKKKNYRRTIGHRQPRTRIRITGITGYEDFPFETLPEMVPA
ncbi:50S ribosomal protein L21, chloroplastic [Phoenix dactylifera]|uniref:50S ribosomal protein L21, chloroplastic n=1 Tax=Phoenix dactylifera TaxID=42345 RepID=A0A8B7CAB7_PHODC|nr:50S ribosomal protein L21, chloroplastic [Phoenix dactylifera]